MTRKNISDAINNISKKHIEEVMNFREEQEEIKMEKINRKKTTWLKWKPATVAAALALFVCVSGVTALAATGVLQGFFADVFRWDGAVVGTRYEQATNEIEISVSEVSDQLIVEMEMVYPDKFPYRSIKVFGIESYKIVDMDNKVVTKGTTTELATVADGMVSISIPLDNISNGNYKLVISELTGSESIEDPYTNPLILSGTWECDFIK